MIKLDVTYKLHEQEKHYVVELYTYGWLSAVKATMLKTQDDQCLLANTQNAQNHKLFIDRIRTLGETGNTVTIDGMLLDVDEEYMLKHPADVAEQLRNSIPNNYYIK